MLVTVSVPADMPATEARREVRTLITDQRNYAAWPGDVKAIVVKSKPRDHSAARIAQMQHEIDTLLWQLGRGRKPQTPQK